MNFAEIPVSVRLTPRMIADLDEAAVEDNTTKSKMIREMIEDGLKWRLLLTQSIAPVSFADVNHG